MTAKPRGTSREYLLSRLERDEHWDLLEAVHSNQISCYAAAEVAGYIKRPPTIAGDDCNQSRRRRFALARALSGNPYEQRRTTVDRDAASKEAGSTNKINKQGDDDGQGASKEAPREFSGEHAAKTVARAERDDDWLKPAPFDPAALIG